MNENSNIAETKGDVKYNSKIYKKTSKRKNNVISFDFAEKEINTNRKVSGLESQQQGVQI